MTEHHHNHEHLIGEGENGEEIVFAVLQRFEANGKNFVLFAEEKEGGSEIQAAIIETDENGAEELVPVEAEEDLAAVGEMLESLAVEEDDEQQLEQIVAVDDSGNEITFDVITRFTIGEKTYVAFVEQGVEQPELQVATITENEAGEQGLAPIETEEEFEKVQQVINEILAND